MILSENEVKERIESPMNLLNRLKSITSKSDNRNGNHGIVSIPPSADKLIEDLDDKLNFGSAKSKAMGLMISAMDELKNRLPEVTKPRELASIAESMGKIVNNSTIIRNEQNNRVGQIIVYAPQLVSEELFDVIDARGME